MIYELQLIVFLLSPVESFMNVGVYFGPLLPSRIKDLSRQRLVELEERT